MGLCRYLKSVSGFLVFFKVSVIFRIIGISKYRNIQAGLLGIPVLKVENSPLPLFSTQILHYQNRIKLFECLSTLDLYTSDVMFAAGLINGK